MGRASLQIAESLARERWGQFVRNIRQAAARTQREAAQLSGVSPSIWKGIELGRTPIEKYIEPVAAGTGVSAEELRARAQEIREKVSAELGIEGVGEQTEAVVAAAETVVKRRRGRPRKSEAARAATDKVGVKGVKAARAARKEKGRTAARANKVSGKAAAGVTRAVRNNAASKVTSVTSKVTSKGSTSKGRSLERVFDAEVGALFGGRALMERIYEFWTRYEALDERRRRLVDLLLQGGEQETLVVS